MAIELSMLATQYGNTLSAIGGLGVAAQAVVDACKFLPNGGPSHLGFDYIRKAAQLFIPGVGNGEEAHAVTGALLNNLHGNWVNGMALADQKAIAKSLIKLRLDPDNATQYAKVADVDVSVLKQIATKLQAGQPLQGGEEANAMGRFELALTAILDGAYQRADQRYRNGSRVCAGVVSLGLAGAISVGADQSLMTALLVGLLAVPLAPISKDLTSGLAAAVKALQSTKR